MEVVRLRVNDIDFDQLQLRIWNGKGFKHRLTTLAPELVSPGTGPDTEGGIAIES